MKDLHAIAQERQVVEAEIKSLRTQITNNEELLADKRKRLSAELTKLADLRLAANAVFDRTETVGLPEQADDPPPLATEDGPKPEMIVHASDCAVHNEPALPAGPCDCGTEPPDDADATHRRFEDDNRFNSIFSEPADLQAQAMQNGLDRIGEIVDEARR